MNEQSKDDKAYDHQAGNREKQRQIGRLVLGLSAEYFNHYKRIDKTYRTHQVDHRIAFAAERRRSQIRHQRYGRRAVETHGKKQQEKHDHEHRKITGTVLRVENE